MIFLHHLKSNFFVKLYAAAKSVEGELRCKRINLQTGFQAGLEISSPYRHAEGEVLLPGPRVAVEHPVEFTCVRGAPLVVTLDFPVESSFRLTTAGVAFTPTLATDAVRVAP